MMKALNRNLDHPKRFFYLAVVCFVLCILFQTGYRSYIYTHHIDDYGIAGSAVSFWSALAGMFYIYYRCPQTQPALISIAFCVGCALYELIQPHVKLGVFDWNDLWAIVLAGLTFRIICAFQPGSDT